MNTIADEIYWTAIEVGVEEYWGMKTDADVSRFNERLSLAFPLGELTGRTRDEVWADWNRAAFAYVE